MTKEIKLMEVYQEAAVAMSKCFRSVADVLDTNKSLDMTPAELQDMIADLIATLVIADAHAQAMSSTQQMMDRGYETVSVERVNHQHAFIPMNVAGTIVGWCVCGTQRGMPPERKDKE